MDKETGNDLTLSLSIKDHLGNSTGKQKGRKNHRAKKPKPEAKRGPSNPEPFSPEQIRRLMEVFQVDMYPSQRMKSDLSKELGLTFAQVKHWFQNHRYQWKNEMKREEWTRLRNKIKWIRRDNSRLRAEADSLKCKCGSAVPKPLQNENAIVEEEMSRIRGSQNSMEFMLRRPSVPTTLNLLGSWDNSYRQCKIVG